MDYKFLNKVLDQLVRETEIDKNRGVIESPFFSLILVSSFLHLLSFRSSLLLPSFTFLSFSDHCRDVYGLNVQEIKYVWKEYVQTIIDKINNGL